MLKTVIAIDADLASRIAIRYACQLGRSLDMTISTVHALEPGEEGNAIATGWVRRTWEGAVVREAKEQVIHLVRSEQTRCRPLESPLFLPPGRPRADRIAEQLRASHYDLFVEGLIHRFERDTFLEKIGSRLYRGSPCPILLAQNVPPWAKGVLWVSDGMMTEQMVERFLRIFPIQSVELKLLNCKFSKSPSATVQGSSSPNQVGPALSLLESSLKNISTVEGSPSSMAALVRDHSLIVSSLPRKNSPMAELLSKSPCTLLFLP